MTRVELSDIPGVIFGHSNATFDSRGSFTKYFNREFTQESGFDPEINSLSVSTNIETGTIRGLHFQSPPFEEEKVVVCLAGRIFDVIVDLRKDSPTRGNYSAIELDSAVPTALCLPKGIAHGYQTLSPKVSILYALGARYSAEHARILNYADSELGIEWPLPVTQISEKDHSGISLHQALSLAN